MLWNAKWIWNDTDEASPRNEWWCFRKTFNGAANFAFSSQDKLHITADSRYIVYLNGKKLGFGPVRSWPFRQAYDTYNIGHLLNKGENTLAVLVMHWGISNFYYLRGRGGLLVQMDGQKQAEAEDGCIETALVSDESWRCTRYKGQDSRSVRMSVQQSFAEVIDAGAWDGDWTSIGYDDSSWARAKSIGNAGMPPWTELIPRDIPFLTEEPVVPSRVLSFTRVRPVEAILSLDLGAHFRPDSVNRANSCEFLGMLATVIRSPKKMSATLGFPWGLNRDCRHMVLNGRRLELGEMTGEAPQAYINVDLLQGDNFFLLDVSGPIRRPLTWTLIAKSDLPVAFASPMDGSTFNSPGEYAPVVTLGPFDWIEPIDHAQDRKILNKQQQDYLQALNFVAWDQMLGMTQWMKPVSKALATDIDVMAACVCKDVLAQLPIPYAMQRLVTASHDAAEIPSAEEGDIEFIVDFGEQRSGFIAFTVEAEAGAILDFYGYEHQDEHGIQHTFGLHNTFRYVCREGLQTYESPVRRGLRYLMLTVRGNKRPIQFHRLQCVQSNYPVAEVGEFQCSDDRLARIWDISRRTTKLCMEDTFVDCPAYEQAFWVGDARNEALVNYYVFGATDIVRRCLELVPYSKFQSPFFADQIPSGWNSVIPNWTFFWIIACAEYVETTNDLEFLHNILPEVRYTLEHYVRNINALGLLEMNGWNLLDWAPIDQPNRGIVAHQNMFLVKALEKAAEIAVLAEDPDTGHFVHKHLNPLRKAINQHLWSEEKLAYLDCIHDDGRRSDIFSMQTQVVAFLCGIPEGRRKGTIAAYLTDPPLEFVQIGSPFMSFFYHEALAMVGNIQHILDDTRKNWGMMLDHGATTCWEMFPGNAINRANKHFLTRSHTHAWSAAPGYFLGAYVLGVRPIGLGYKEVLVEPHPCDLQWAKGSVPIPGGGRIDVRWFKQEDGTIDLTVEAPDSLSIQVKLPEGVKGNARINGNNYII